LGLQIIIINKILIVKRITILKDFLCIKNHTFGSVAIGQWLCLHLSANCDEKDYSQMSNQNGFEVKSPREVSSEEVKLS